MTSAIKHKRRSQYSYGNTVAILGHFQNTATKKNASKQIAKVNKEIGLLTRLRNFFGLKRPESEK